MFPNDDPNNVPFAKVNEATTLSGSALKSSFVAWVFRPNAFVKKGTAWTGEPSAPANASVYVTPLTNSTFELRGNVAPLAEILIVPVPSDDIVEPPMSIVSPAKNNERNLFEAEPKS